MSRNTYVFVGWLSLCILAPVFSQTSAPEGIVLGLSSSGLKPGEADNMRQQAQLAERFVHERLAVWRQCLHLEDWQISVVMTRRNDLKPKTRGHIRWDKDKKSAVIGVLDASDYRLPFREMLDDMEFTIVHELVHLELASLTRSEASRGSEERAVNGIAQALLALDRKKQ